MGKISPVSAKYIINTLIQIEGAVDRPDVIGAIFGQTEGLLGSELELRELQRSGRVGRIEVKLDTKGGKTQGNIIIPSSMDKAETAIIGAALETIERIGPCNAKVSVESLEDVRITKRSYVIERAKELLKNMTDTVLPDSQEITIEVAQSVRMMEVQEYGPEKLAAGPGVDEAEDLIVVEGRADVLNLLKQGMKNVICLNGTSVPQTIQTLSRQKTITCFLDGDRGGDLIIKEMLNCCEIDYVIRAPDGKEVEELTQKEIHKALRNKVAVEQVKLDIERGSRGQNGARRPQTVQQRRPPVVTTNAKPKVDDAKLREMLEGMVGTRGACILDTQLQVLGKVPVTELQATLSNLPDSYAVVLDGVIDGALVSVAEKTGIVALVGMGANVQPTATKVLILTPN
ncbi:hypothetical protein CL622_03290 [archaeon]|nr:hypothetical protein [archaeon]